MYHSVNNTPPKTEAKKDANITPENLRAQLTLLKKMGYTFISASEMEKLLSGKKTSQGPSILVTFDDGYEDNYTEAYPILKKLRIKALINVVVKSTDQPLPPNSQPHLSWAQIKEMTRSGLIEIGNHTYDSHVYGKSVDGGSVPMLAARMIINGKAETTEDFLKRVTEDFVKAERLIKQYTGVKPSVMVYPFGWTCNDARAIAKSLGYKIQPGIKPGVNTTQKDLENIKRITVRYDHTPAQLEKIISGYMLKPGWSDIVSKKITLMKN